MSSHSLSLDVVLTFAFCDDTLLLYRLLQRFSLPASKRKSQTAAGLGKLDFCVPCLLSRARVLTKKAHALSLTGAITLRAAVALLFMVKLSCSWWWCSSERASVSEVKSARGKRAQINWTLFLFRVFV